MEVERGKRIRWNEMIRVNERIRLNKRELIEIFGSI